MNRGVLDGRDDDAVGRDAAQRSALASVPPEVNTTDRGGTAKAAAISSCSLDKIAGTAPRHEPTRRCRSHQERQSSPAERLERARRIVVEICARIVKRNPAIVRTG